MLLGGWPVWMSKKKKKQLGYFSRFLKKINQNKQEKQYLNNDYDQHFFFLPHLPGVSFDSTFEDFQIKN